jgi:hypothetical protein
VHSASRNKRALRRAKSRGCDDANTAQPVVTSLLTREPAERTTKRQHPPRGAHRRADSDRPGVCVINDATRGGRLAGAWTGARAGLLCRSRCIGENELTGSSECGPRNEMTYAQLSGPKDRRSPRLRLMMEQDVDLSAVSAVVDVSSADGRQQCRSNGWQRTLEYGPLNPAGSGRQPSGTTRNQQCGAVQSKKSN